MREQRIFEFNLMEIEGILSKYIGLKFCSLTYDKENDLFVLHAQKYGEGSWEYNTPTEMKEKMEGTGSYAKVDQ